MLGLCWRNWSPLGEEVYSLERSWSKQELLKHTTDYSATCCNYSYLFILFLSSDFMKPASPRHHPSDTHSPGRKARKRLP